VQVSAITRDQFRHIVLLAGLLLLAAFVQPSFSDAGTVTLSAGTLDYSAASGEQNRVFIFNGGASGFRVIDTSSAITAGSGCTSLTANEAFCPSQLTGPSASPIDIHVAGGDLNDFVEVATSFYNDAILDGGAGADELQGGTGSSNILDSGPGSDTFRPGPGSGLFPDIVDYSSRTNPLSVSLGDGLANDGEAGEQDLIEDGIRVARGGSGNDTMSAHAVGFQIFDLFGRGGDDTLTVDSGDSTLDGGGGDDILVADSSPREGFILSGAGGNDVLRGGKGSDLLEGGGGNDRLRCSEEGTFAIGGKGADVIHGGPDGDRMEGGAGPDTFFARHGGLDLVTGGDGHDRARVDHLDRLRSIEDLF
jgi:Ca2+-binding RTX toxin-like protein